MGGGPKPDGPLLPPVWLALTWIDLIWPEFYHGIKIMPSWLVYIEFHHGTKIMPFLNCIKIMPRWLLCYLYGISSWHYFNANFGIKLIPLWNDVWYNFGIIWYLWHPLGPKISCWTKRSYIHTYDSILWRFFNAKHPCSCTGIILMPSNLVVTLWHYFNAKHPCNCTLALF